MMVLDITEAMNLRPDVHPSRYGHPPGGSMEGSFVVDCLHWCLPGPVDLQSELLLQMLLSHRWLDFQVQDYMLNSPIG